MPKTAPSMESIVTKNLPNIKKVALNIAYDNGMVNRLESEEDYLHKVATIISKKPIIWCLELEAWLKTKNPIEQDIIAVGEHEEMMALINDAPRPEFTNDLFNAFFEGE